jgi:selenocysteine-specific translation elongation factor
MSFKFFVEDVFSITGRGTVVTGFVEHGSIRVGEDVEIRNENGTIIPTRINGIEQFRKVCEVANEGEACGILLQGVSKKDVCHGSCLVSIGWNESEIMKNSYDTEEAMHGYQPVDMSALNSNEHSSLLNGGIDENKKKWWQKLF